MANKEHLAWLNKGKDAWNEWRANNPEIQADLELGNFAGKNLKDFNFCAVKLMGADLMGADLSGANLMGADLRQAILTGANLKQGKLILADLTQSDLSEAYLIEANFTQANLTKAKLSKDFTVRIDLLAPDPDLLIKLMGDGLKGPIFAEANLTYADLSGANFIRTNFTKADLYRATLRGTYLSSADFRGAKLSEANLSGADLSKANLSQTDFILTQLSKANLTGACLTGACIEYGNINITTNVDDINCDYVYLRKGQQERRPHSRNFARGEFAKLFQTAKETVDLVFLNGIDWQAFLVSFLKLKAESGSDDISIQSFENRNGAFIIRINVSPGADKGAIEKYVERVYQLEAQLQVRDEQLSFYREELTVKRQENTSLLRIAEIIAEKETYKIENTFNTPSSLVENRGYVDSPDEEGKDDYQYVIEQDTKRFKVLKAIYRDSGGKPGLATELSYIVETTGIGAEELIDFLLYLKTEELIKPLNSLYYMYDGESAIVQITHKGVREVEAAIRKPNESTEHFSYQVFQNIFSRDVNGFQQGGQGNSSNIIQNIKTDKFSPDNQTSDKVE